MEQTETTEQKAVATEYVRYCFYDFWTEDGRFKAKYGIEDCEPAV